MSGPCIAQTGLGVSANKHIEIVSTPSTTAQPVCLRAASIAFSGTARLRFSIRLKIRDLEETGNSPVRHARILNNNVSLPSAWLTAPQNTSHSEEGIEEWLKKLRQPFLSNTYLLLTPAPKLPDTDTRKQPGDDRYSSHHGGFRNVESLRPDTAKTVVHFGYAYSVAELMAPRKSRTIRWLHKSHQATHTVSRRG